MKPILVYLFMFSVITYSCGEKGTYEYKNTAELDKAYRVLRGLEEKKLKGSRITNANPGMDRRMRNYLNAIGHFPLQTPVLETQTDSLFEDWGIYEQSGDAEDTLFYVHLLPKISRIGDENEDIWVIESVSCRWWKSWKIRDFDIRPFVQIRYLNANFEPEYEDERITSEMILQIAVRQSSWLNGTRGINLNGGVGMDSRRRGWIASFSDNFYSSIGKGEPLIPLLDEGWEIRSRGNVFKGLNY